VRHILRSQAAEPSFLRDEDGLYRYAVILTALGNFFRERGLARESGLMQRIVTDLLPKYYPGVVLKGILQAERGQPEAAENSFAEAIAIDPRRPEARRNLALLHLNRRRYTEAAREWKSLLSQAPEDAAAHYYLGVSYEALGNMPAAYHHLREAQKLDPAGEIGLRAGRELEGSSR